LNRSTAFHNFRIMPRPALGLVETSGIEGAIKATRAASESGEVVIVSAEQGALGRMTVKIEGEWSAVQGAVEAGARAAYVAGELVSMHVIPKSDDEVSAIMPYPRFVGRYSPEESPSAIPRKPAPAKPQPVHAVPSAKPPRKPAAVKPPAVVARPAPVVVIPREESAPVPSAPVRTSPAPDAADQPTWEQLQGMSVVKLRKYARAIPELPIKGRQISIANKDQLLAAIATIRPA
jgi:ethanolamine utilization protein EutM